jgi:hypothetical protein
MYAMKGPGHAYADGSLGADFDPLRAFADGSLGDSLTAFQDGSLGDAFRDGSLGCHTQVFRNGSLGLLAAFQDGSLGDSLTAFQDGSLGAISSRDRLVESLLTTAQNPLVSAYKRALAAQTALLVAKNNDPRAVPQITALVQTLWKGLSPLEQIRCRVEAARGAAQTAQNRKTAGKTVSGLGSIYEPHATVLGLAAGTIAIAGIVYLVTKK